MPVYENHKNKMENINKAIEQYKNGKISQKKCADHFKISLNVFRYYFNKKPKIDNDIIKEKIENDIRIEKFKVVTEKPKSKKATDLIEYYKKFAKGL